MSSTASFLTVPPPRLDLHPLPYTRPLTTGAALAPPLLYYIGLLLLPPFPRPHRLIPIVRSALALLSGFLFFRLPFRYHVPLSVGLTYQLALVGVYGGLRVLDVFFVAPCLFGHIPRRVKYQHAPRVETPAPTRMGGEADSYFSMHFMIPKENPVTETASTDEGWPHGWWDRANWALELELSMRGAGFTWTSADVRHAKKTWMPTVGNRIHSILLHVLPVLAGSWGIIRWIFVEYVSAGKGTFDDLPFPLQLLLTAALGGFLMCAFSLGHSSFAIMLSPLSPHPLAYFPPLYTSRVWDIKSVRGFWSYGWHRLFSRLFLVYGVWPGEWLERTITGKGSNQPADIGKVVGAFVSSAFVHSFASWTVHGGIVGDALGEARFFAGCGLSVVLEEVTKRAVMRSRKQQKGDGKEDKDSELERWYDGWVGRIWWISVLLFFGRNFARGWVSCGLVAEMSGL